MTLGAYLHANAVDIAYFAGQHILLFLLSLAAAAAIGLALGIAVVRLRLAANIAVPIVNVLQLSLIHI